MNKKHTSFKIYFLFLFLFSSILSGCGKTDELPRADESDDTIKPVDSVEESITPSTFWGFDEGPPVDWEFGPAWTFENGAASISEPGQPLISLDSWQDFNLATRISIEEDTIFGLLFRNSDEGSSQILFEPGGVELISEMKGETKSIGFNEINLEPGFHELQIIVSGKEVVVYSDDWVILENNQVNLVNPGSVGFIIHNNTNLSIDYVEVQNADTVKTAENLEEEIITEASNQDAMPTRVIHDPPIANLITVHTPDDNYNTLVVGEPGSTAPNSMVMIGNLETSLVYFATADENGGFEKEIFSHPSSSIEIKHFYPAEEEEYQKYLTTTEPIQYLDEWIFCSSGTILAVPEGESNLGDGISFTVSGFAAGKVAYWYFQGQLNAINDSPENLQVGVKGTFYLTSHDLTNRINPSDFEAGLHTFLVRHIDEEGQQDVVRQYMVSDYLSPTGFPISHGEIPWSPIPYLHIVNNWQVINQDTLSSNVEFVLANEDNFPLKPGYYGLLFEVGAPEGLEGDAYQGPNMRPGVYYGNGGFYSPIFKVGEVLNPNLYWTLLTDTLYEATRGTSSREDQNRLGIIPMISLQSHQFILPKEDPKTGDPLSYRLEPFLPLIAFADRGLPNPPTIDFAFPSGSLEVTVKKPDGNTDKIGPAPFVQSVNATPGYDWGKVKDYSIGGGGMQEVYQLSTLDDAFNYAFDQYGHYEIIMKGSINDMYGNSYSGGGTYDIWVARPLKLYSGMLPNAPYIEGDGFSPSLQIYPRVPANVDIRLTVLPNSSPENQLVQNYTGKANLFGYFYSNEAPYVFQSGGEYRVDMTASYQDKDGTLWMGSATWGNIIENRDAKLIAHGIRGLDHPDIRNLWFFHQQLDLEAPGIADEPYHTYYPYYSGDVFWGHDLEDDEAKGSNAILPGVTFEDTSGELLEFLPDVWENKAHSEHNIFNWDIQTMIENGEIIPFSTTSTGWGLNWFPELIDQYSYAYFSNQRPGARVYESLGEGIIPISYWRYDGTFGDQVGVEGDLPNDLKWQFGGVVLRNSSQEVNEYAAYASLWVLLPDDDPIGGRVTPPFQGTTGGPNGGPIMTLKGEAIDLFFLPRSGFPGQILEVGDILSFSGHVGPPIDSKLAIVITSPSGNEYEISGQANKVGYFYQPESDIIVEEPGVWRVTIQVTHDGMTSSGPTVPPYPTGGVLGTSEGTYNIYVVKKGSQKTSFSEPMEGYLQIQGNTIEPIHIIGEVPGSFENATITYTIGMPGFVLEQAEALCSGNEFDIVFDPVRLHEDFPNLDLTAYDELRSGLADQIWISALFEKDGQYLPLTTTFHGEEVFHR